MSDRIDAMNRTLSYAIQPADMVPMPKPAVTVSDIIKMAERLKASAPTPSELVTAPDLPHSALLPEVPAAEFAEHAAANARLTARALADKLPPGITVEEAERRLAEGAARHNGRTVVGDPHPLFEGPRTAIGRVADRIAKNAHSITPSIVPSFAKTAERSRPIEYPRGTPDA